MSDVRPVAPPRGTPADGMRPLTPGEQQHLQALRAYVASGGIDVRDADAVGAAVHAARAAWSPSEAPVPEGLVAAFGVVVGDLVLARADDARWTMRVAGGALSPAVVSASGDDVVLPLDDTRSRWLSGVGPDWAAGYVAAAAAHLHASAPVDVPRPRPPQAETVPPERATPGPRTDRTPADLPHPPSAEVVGLALHALDAALDAVVGGEPVVRAFAASGGEVLTQAFGEHADDTERARAWVRMSGARVAAVAWEGRLPDDAFPAVLVESGEAGLPSMIVAHRYAPARPAGAGRARPPRPIGDPVVVRNGGALL